MSEDESKIITEEEESKTAEGNKRKRSESEDAETEDKTVALETAKKLKAEEKVEAKEKEEETPAQEVQSDAKPEESATVAQEASADPTPETPATETPAPTTTATTTTTTTTEVAQGTPAAAVATPKVETTAPTSSYSLSAYQPLGASTGETTRIISIAQDKVGQVIGSKGMIIQEIQTRTGAKAYVNQDFPDGVNREVHVTGMPEQVNTACDLINLIIEQGPTAIHVNSMSGGPTITQVIECTQNQVGKIIGSGGATIKDLQSKSGARIQIDQDFPPDVPRKINITGTAPAVSHAVQLVQNIMAGQLAGFGSYGGAPAVGGGSFGGGQGGEGKQSMEVPKAVVGRIIGRGGETITIIQRKSGARVTVDQSVPDGAPCKVMMSGTPQTIGAAIHLVQEIMMGVPAGKLGSHMPASMTANSPYGMPQQTQPFGMAGYGMPQMMGQPQAGYGYGGYPQQQQQMPMQQYGMPAAGGYQSYGAAAGAYGAGAAGAAAVSGYGQMQQTQAAVKPVGGSVWTEHKTDDGITYWYNASTGVSQWERPKV